MESLVFVQNAKPDEEDHLLLPEREQMDEYYFLKVSAEDGGFPANFQKFVRANLTGDKRQDHVKLHLAIVDQSRHE